MPDRRCDRLCILQENLEKYKLEVKTVQMHSEDVGWQRVLFVRNRWKNHPYPVPVRNLNRNITKVLKHTAIRLRIHIASDTVPANSMHIYKNDYITCLIISISIA